MKKLLLISLIFIFIVISSDGYAKNNTDKSIKADSGSWIHKNGYLENTLKVGEFTIMRYSLDGKQIFTFGKDIIFRRWDVETGKVVFEKRIARFSTSSYDSSHNISDISPNGKQILVAGWYEKYSERGQNMKANIYLYDIENEYIIYIVNPSNQNALQPRNWGDPPFIFGVSIEALFSQDGSKFTSIIYFDLENSNYANIGAFTNWRTDNGLEIGPYGTGYVNSYAFSKNSQHVACSYHVTYPQLFHGDSWLKLDIDIIKKYQDSANYNYIEGYPSNVLFTNDNKNLMWTDYENNIKYLYRWDIPHKYLVSKIPYYNSGFNITNDDRFIFTLTDSSVSFIKFPEIVKSFETRYDYPVYNGIIKLNPQKNEIASASGGIIRIINLEKLNNNLIAIFNSSQDTALINEIMYFIDYSYGNPTSYQWDFGDGQYSTNKNPVHSYSKTGKYTVRLIISDNLKSDTLIKIDFITVMVRTDVKNITDINTNFSIIPNPVNQSTEIRYQITDEGNVKLTLVSCLGHEIVTLVDEWQSTGEHNYQFLINNYQLSDGVYYLKLVTATNITTKKIIIIK